MVKLYDKQLNEKSENSRQFVKMIFSVHAIIKQSIKNLKGKIIRNSNSIFAD